MSLSVVERNDVDVAPLFAWSKEFKVISKGEEVPVFMRLVGDADINRARVAALRKSADLRGRLRDINSDERVVFIKDIDDIEIENLVAVIAVFSMRDIAEAATKRLKIKVPKTPKSDAKTSVQEKYQAELDSYPERRQAELRSLIEKDIEVLKESLEKEPKEKIYKKYVNIMSDELCEQELLKTFKSWCAYLGSYKNEELSERLFSSYEEFDNLQPNLKEQFINEYSRLELYGDDLKKLLQVTR